MSTLRSRLLLCLCGILLLQGCAHRRVNEIAADLPFSGPQATLAELETLSPPGRDRAQYLLDRGLLKTYVGDTVGARADLEEAKQIMAALQAVSITENLAAATTNETLRSYSGTPSDQALVHFMLALNYLFEGDLDGARVEMLQADVKMQELADGYSVSGQMASVRFLAGFVYELNGEFDDALISYRRAYRIMKERFEAIPEALQISLLNLSRRQGFDEEYADYTAEFGREHDLPTADELEWVLIYHEGVVSDKIENRFPIFDPGLNTMVTVVVPAYPSNAYYPIGLSLEDADAYRNTAVLENLERRSREDLQSEMPGILAAATIRAAGKYTMMKSAQDNNDFAIMIAAIAAFASEQADLRSWNMLPSSIQVARLKVARDERIVIPQRGFTSPPAGELAAGSAVLVFTTSLSNRVLTYPPLIVPETVGGPDADAAEPDAETVQTDAIGESDV